MKFFGKFKILVLCLFILTLPNYILALNENSGAIIQAPGSSSPSGPGSWPSQRFNQDVKGADDNNSSCDDETYDKLTGLEWYLLGSNKTYDVDNAKAYAKGAQFCHYTDWRLPTINELMSLMNYTSKNTINWLESNRFKNLFPSCYWSSTAYYTQEENAEEWYLVLDNESNNFYGRIIHQSDTQLCYVILVRSPDPTAPST